MVDFIENTFQTFIIIILRDSFLTDGGAHGFIIGLKWLLGFGSGKRTIAGSLSFTIDIIFAEISILRVNKVSGSEFYPGYIFTERYGMHLFSWAWSDRSIWFVVLPAVDATYFFPLWHKYFIKKQYNLICFLSFCISSFILIHHSFKKV